MLGEVAIEVRESVSQSTIPPLSIEDGYPQSRNPLLVGTAFLAIDCCLR